MDDYAEKQQVCSWSNLLFNSILPCCGCKCLPFYNLFNTPTTMSTVIGTIICPVDSNGKVKLYLQKDLGSFPFILLDLPLEVSEFARLIHVGTTRVVLSRAYGVSGSCSISIMQWWLMQCNGKQKGIAVKRQMSPKDKYLLDMIQAVSTGAGFLPCKESGGYKYLRCRFQQTVGSDGSEGYHLIDPSNCFHQADLSFFFVRH